MFASLHAELIKVYTVGVEFARGKRLGGADVRFGVIYEFVLENLATGTGYAGAGTLIGLY
jgi:hypothetical protein